MVTIKEKQEKEQTRPHAQDSANKEEKKNPSEAEKEKNSYLDFLWASSLYIIRGYFEVEVFSTNWRTTHHYTTFNLPSPPTYIINNYGGNVNINH